MRLCNAEINKNMRKWTETPEVSLNDLPKFSPWLARMLGLTEWSRGERTAEDAEREYERETFFPQYQFLLDNSEVKDFPSLDIALYPERQDVLCTIKGVFKKISLQDAYAIENHIIAQRLSQYLPANAFVDIGAGSGRTIIAMGEQNVFSGMQLFALEKMYSARKMITMMSLRRGVEINVGECDLMKSPLTQTNIPEGSVIYTNSVMAAMHRPVIDIVLDILKFKPKIVIHFEPLLSMCECSTVYGQLCASYLKMNKYNVEFDAGLREIDGKDIEIIDVEANVFGNNPFFSKSILVWKPKLSLYEL